MLRRRMGAMSKGILSSNVKKLVLKNAPSLKYKWKCDDFIFLEIRQYFSKKKGGNM
jgi:hypothetical protein